jgi:DNA modification methylase
VTVQLLHGDCRERMAEMADASVDAIVCDPPYGLSFMGKGWDYSVPGTEVWAECLRVLKPGGHLVAFAGTRTQHRMAVRIEDAGFEIRDMLAWLYGSGFPKSLDVSKAIDKAAGAVREVMATRTKRGLGGSSTFAQDAWTQAQRGEIELAITDPATEAAKHWQGWGTALKPALEPITLARKPLIGTVASNVLQHGTGALNIDACRVEYVDSADKESAAAAEQRSRQVPNRNESHEWGMKQQAITAEDFMRNTGRWPANIIHDGSDEVVALFPQSDGQQGDVRGTEPSGVTNGIYGEFAGRIASASRNDLGSAARFFYAAKATQEDRNEGCCGLPERTGGMVSNTSGQHITRRDGGAPGPRPNHHPTVKPTDLMRWLCRLITPKGGLILDPFMGSGSTGKAAVLEGFRFIGIDLSPEYVEIARARIDFARRQGHQPSLLEASL